jgi:hypothetical protein
LIPPVVIVNNNTGSNYTVYINTGNGEIVDPDNTIFVYFPVTSTQAVFSGVSVGAALIGGGGSMILTNLIAMWGPLEFIAYGG